jgi:predicted lipid-binding transport protein (Tim44 family)
MDIIFLAIIAIYIFFKLRGELGKVDEDQKRDAIKNFIKEQTKTSNANSEKPTIITVPGVGFVDQNVSEIDVKSQKVLDALDLETKNDLIAVLEKSKISAANFMDGAVKAFEMIIEAFASGNIETLKPLLSEKIFAQFEAAILQRKNTGQILNTKILAIDENKITSAKMLQNFALITIKFASKQINYLTNNSGEIIDGSKEDVNAIIDIWTFKKDSLSSNPNWFVSATADQ